MSLDQRSEGLTFLEREVDEVSMLSVSGDLDFAAAGGLCARMHRISRAGGRCLLLDLRDLRFCEPRAVRAVSGAVEEFIANAGVIAIVPPTEDVPAEVFAASGVLEFLPLHDSVFSALAALNES
jgi:anti-anti-sigma factor